MRAANRQSSRRRTAPVFRFQRAEVVEEMGSPSPFTETPRELKRGWSVVGRWLRALINTLFMGMLILALLALIIVFALQMIYNPTMLASWAYHLIQSIQSFFVGMVGS